MSVYKSRGKWVVDVRQKMPDGSTYPRQRLTSPVQTRRGAEQFEREVRAAILAGTYVPKKKRADAVTLDDLAEDFLLWIGAERKSGTAKNYRNKLTKHVLPLLGDCRLEDVSNADALKLVSAMRREGMGHSSINNAINALRGVLRYAVRAELIRQAPKLQGVTTPPPSKTRWLTHDEARVLIEAMNLPYWQAMARWVLATGCRIGEVIGLQWDDIDEGRTQAIIQRTAVAHNRTLGPTKGGRPRVLPLGDGAREALRIMSEHRSGPFVWHRQGRMRGHSGVLAAMTRARERSGLDGVTWHTLRHTYASWLAQSGVTMRVLRDLLGHGDIAMTMRYAHMSPATLADAIEHLPDL